MNYSTVDEMIEILDENGADEFRIRGPQIRNESVIVAEDFPVLAHQLPVVLWHSLMNYDYYYYITYDYTKDEFTFFQAPHKLPTKGIGLGPGIP